MALIGLTDATVDDSQGPQQNVPARQTDDYGKRLATFRERIAARIGEAPAVFYSAYKTDGDGLPIDNLDEIAVEGRVQFHAEYDEFWGEGESYTSPVVESPTWLDVAVLADAMIKTTGDYHHQFLEGLQVDGEEDGVKMARFRMGS